MPPALVAIGALQLAGYFAFAHVAVAWVPAGRTAILANTTTIWIVPLSLVFLHERIPPRRWAAAGIGLAGVVVLMSPWAIDWTSPQVLIGHGFLLMASLCWSVAIVVTRVARPSLSMFELLPWCFGLASLLLLPLVLWEAPHGTLGDAAGMLVALAYIGLVAGPLGTWCVVEATAKLPAMVSSVGFLTTPAVSLLLANLLLGEQITADLLAGLGVDHRRRGDRRVSGRRVADVVCGAGWKGEAPMILHTIEAGQGPPVALLHGLFGSARNLGVVQRALAPRFRVLALDLRNHGASPHAAAMDYPAMAADVLETLDQRAALPAALVGHSMGGKAAMMAALTQPDQVSRLVVADIAPVAYEHHNARDRRCAGGGAAVARADARRRRRRAGRGGAGCGAARVPAAEPGAWRASGLAHRAARDRRGDADDRGLGRARGRGVSRPDAVRRRRGVGLCRGRSIARRSARCFPPRGSSR